jgi:aspartokinase
MRASWQALVNGGFLALLAACAGDSAWEKPGASKTEREQVVAECRAEARHVTDRESRIDQDITSTMHQDWQRTGVLESRRASFRDRTLSHGEAVFTRCMAARGWVRPG